jgi:hypothetical protein
MSAVRDQVGVSLAEHAWDRLACLDGEHQVVLRVHEQLRRRLDEAIATKDEIALRAAWDDYKGVLADLDKVTEDLETLRLTSD